MKVIPVASASEAAQSGTAESHRADIQRQTDLREKAIGLLSGNESTPQAPKQPLQRQLLHREEEEQTGYQVPEMTEPVYETAASEPVETIEEAPKAEDKQLSSQYALLAKREKALRAKAQQQEQVYRTREKALADREAALSSQPQAPSIDMSQYISVDRFKSDPIGVMAETGLTYDELAQQLISQQQPLDPRTERQMQRLNAANKALEDKLAKFEESQVKNQQDAYTSALNVIKNDVRSLVKGNVDQFEMISRTNSIDDVVELIETTYKEEGLLMSNEEAAQAIEDYLTEEAYKLSEAKKIRARMALNASKSSQAATAQKPAVPQPKQQQPMKTLTNAVSTPGQTLSARERAILLVEGKLNK